MSIEREAWSRGHATLKIMKPTLSMNPRSPRHHNGAMRSLVGPNLAALTFFIRRRLPSLVLQPNFCRASYHSAQRFEQTSASVTSGNGQVLLDILQPVTRSGAKKPGSRNVIVYLPPGPLFASQSTTAAHTKAENGGEKDDGSQAQTAQRALAAASSATVVTVNYRLDRRTKDEGGDMMLKYPVPVHDSLAGFDWIFNNLKPRQLCVFGSHIGGSLAMMLALTESRSIRAVAALEPVCDWVGLDDYCQLASDTEAVSAESGESSATVHSDESAAEAKPRHKRGRRKKHAPPDLVPLLEARNRLFHKPSGYFDCFASPALFLRSSAKTCPKVFPKYLTGPEYPVPVLQKPVDLENEDDEWYADVLGTDSDIDFSPEAVEPASSSTTHAGARRRKVLARWPPHGLDYGLDQYGSRSEEASTDPLVLPNVRVFVHSNVRQDHDEIATVKEEDTPLAHGDSLHHEAESGQMSTEAEATKPRHTSRGPITDIMKSTTGETVLARQGAEMVSLMHHACFWGHPAGFGHDRVKIVRVPYSAEGVPPWTVVAQPHQGGPSGLDVENDVAKWFIEIFRAEKNKSGN